MDAHGRELDSWDKAIEKTVNVKAKTLLQPLSNTQKIDDKCLQGYLLAKKEVKNPKKNKSANSSYADMPKEKYFQQSFTHQSQSSKKNDNHQRDFWRRGGQK